MYSIIVNLTSHTGRAGTDWENVEKELKAMNVDYSVYFTKYPGHAGELAAEFASPDSILGVFGGDGTLNEVVTGLEGVPKATILYVPCGSGNDFARGLGLQVNLKNAPYYFAHPEELKPRQLDVGCFETDGGKRRLFAVSGGIGFDAAVCQDIASSRLRQSLRSLGLSKLGYTFAGIRNIFCCPLTDGTLAVNGGEQTIELKKIAFVSAHNLPYEGGGFFFAPEAAPDDGLLDVCAVTAGSHFVFFCTLFRSLFHGSHIRMRNVTYLKARRAELILKSPLYTHTDGEVNGPQRHVVFSVSRSNISVLT